MIDLKDYISNINSLNDIQLHFYAEFILDESLRHSFGQIVENNGSYIGQKDLIMELAKEIYKAIVDEIEEDDFKLYADDLVDDFKNIFFKTLEIRLTDDDTGYVPSNRNYDDNTKMFNKVLICINRNEYNTYDDIARCLMHEIMHAWNDYESYLKKSKTTMASLTNTKSAYYKTLDTGQSTDIESVCKMILNTLRKWEQNAYINELSIELDLDNFDCSKYKTTNEAWKAAYKVFTNSQAWRQYSIFWTFLKKLNTSNQQSQKNEFANEYNRVNNTNLTFNEIYKRLDAQFEKVFRKINRIIPKIFNDYWQEQLSQDVDESIVFGRQNRVIVEFTNYLNTYRIHKDKWHLFNKKNS